MSVARWVPFVGMFVLLVLIPGALANPHTCNTRDDGDFSTQSVAAGPPPIVLAAFLLIPMIGVILAVAGGLAGRSKRAAGTWTYTPQQWVFVPERK